MKQLHKIFLFVSTLSFTGLFAQTTTPVSGVMSADSIFNKYYQATGGKGLWDSVQTYTIKQTYRSGSANDYDLDILGSLPLEALSRTRTIMKRDFIYGIRGTDGWLKIPLGSRDKVTRYQTSDLSEKERETMRRELRDLLNAFDDYTQKGYIATVVAGTELINTKPAYQVELEGKTVKYNLYFDVVSGLLVREKLTLPANEIQTRDHSKYIKSTYGLLYPSESVLVSSIDKKSVKVTTVMDFNTRMAEDAFVR